MSGAAAPPPGNAMRLGPATARRESVPWPVQAGGVPSSPFEGEDGVQPQVGFAMATAHGGGLDARSARDPKA